MPAYKMSKIIITLTIDLVFAPVFEVTTSLAFHSKKVDGIISAISNTPDFETIQQANPNRKGPNLCTCARRLLDTSFSGASVDNFAV